MSSFKDVHLRSLTQGGTSTPNMAVSSTLSGASNVIVKTQSVKTPVVEGNGGGITVGNATEDTKIVGRNVTVPTIRATDTMIADKIYASADGGSIYLGMYPDTETNAANIYLGGIGSTVTVSGLLSVRNSQIVDVVSSSQGVENADNEINIASQQQEGVLNIGTNATRTGEVVIGADGSTTVLNGKLRIGESTGSLGQVLAIGASNPDNLKPYWTTLTMGVTAEYVNTKITEAIEALKGAANTWTGVNTFISGLVYEGKLIANGTGYGEGTGSGLFGDYLGVVAKDGSFVQTWHELITSGTGSGSASSLTSIDEYSDITVGENQTAGRIFIGTNDDRTGNIVIGGNSTNSIVLNGKVNCNGSAGSNGQVLTIVGDKPTWAAPTGLTSIDEYSDITVGENQTAGRIFIGTNDDRTGNIVIGGNSTNSIVLNGKVNCNGSAGSNGQVLTIVGDNPTWAAPTGSSGSTSAGSQPVGSIVMYAGTTAPDGWVFCDGSEYATTDLPELFLVIGTTYGSTNEWGFKVPDLRGCFVRGLKSGETLSSSMTGSETVTLTTKHMPAHSHGVSGHDHSIPNHTHIIPAHDHGVDQHSHTYTDAVGYGIPSMLNMAIGGAQPTVYAYFSTQMRWRSNSSTEINNAENIHTGNETVNIHPSIPYSTLEGGSARTSIYENSRTTEEGVGDSINIAPPNIAMNYIIKYETTSSGTGTGYASSLTSTTPSSAITIGASQTTGAINIGSGLSRSGDINIGTTETTTNLVGSLTCNGTGQAGDVLTIGSDSLPQWITPSTSSSSSLIVGSTLAVTAGRPFAPKNIMRITITSPGVYSLIFQANITVVYLADRGASPENMVGLRLKRASGSAFLREFIFPDAPYELNSEDNTIMSTSFFETTELFQAVADDYYLNVYYSNYSVIDCYTSSAKLLAVKL